MLENFRANVLKCFVTVTPGWSRCSNWAQGPLIHLINTNGFHVKTENERFTAADLCHGYHNLKYKYSTSSFGRPRQ